jgi:hypothetical protein
MNAKSEPLTVEDRLDIQDVIARCAWALDTANVEAFVACFSARGILIWDAFEEPDRWEGSDQLRAFASFLRDLPSSAGRQHHVSNMVITPSPEGAHASSYVTVVLRQGDGPHAVHVMGYYEDDLMREDGRWRIRQRAIRDWSGPILKDFAGQTGQRIARPRPPILNGLSASRRRQS